MARDFYGIPIRRLFLLYMLALLTFILLGGIIAFSLSGGLQSVNDTVILLSKEKDHLVTNVQKKFWDDSAQVVFLSRLLSENIARKLEENRLSISDLNGKPNVITEILGGEINRLILALYLEKTKSSGVFVTLDATVNPNVEGWETSRAGLYVRNIDQGFMDSASSLFLRGPPQIAIAWGDTLQSRWTLEFDVHDQPFWEYPLKALKENPSLPLSRLYHWYFSNNFPGLSENTIVCSAPLLDKEGRFLGVCGFETGARSFAKDNLLDTNSNLSLAGLFFAFSSIDEKRFNSNEALFAGNVILGNELSRQQQLVIGENFHGLDVFRHAGEEVCAGLLSDITLYPNDSPFADTRFAAAVVVSGKDFKEIVSTSRLDLIFIGAVLLCAGITLSLFLSGRYEKPFKKIMSALKSGDMNVKSNIQEIDDLVEFMRSQLEEARAADNALWKTTGVDEENMEKTSEESTENLLDIFIENTKKLTRAEADVFNLYFEGYTAQEIASILSVSINTIKTHNKRIFSKLNVSSRKELLTWVQVLTASGRSLRKSGDSQYKNRID